MEDFPYEENTVSERVKKSEAQEPKNGPRATVQPIPGFTAVTTAVAVFAVLVATAVYAQTNTR